jgi:hypothetical protein
MRSGECPRFLTVRVSAEPKIFHIGRYVFGEATAKEEELVFMSEPPFSWPRFVMYWSRRWYFTS